MKDYLKEYCKPKNIGLKYTKNKVAVLSIENKKDTASIRVHKMFKNCSEDAAGVIIKYYEFYQSSCSIIKFLQNYVLQYYKALDRSGYKLDGLFPETSAKNTIQIKAIKPMIENHRYSNEYTDFSKLHIDDSKDLFNNDKANEPDDDVCIKKHLKDTKAVDVIIKKNKNIMITFKPQKRSEVHGIVKLPDGSAAKNALVKLFVKQNKSAELLPVSFKFTDESGEFKFELQPGEYVLQVFYYDMQIN